MVVSLPLEGGCHCDAVRYRITVPPLMIYNCHCTNCQKISGGAFATSATVFEDALSFTKGAPKKIEWTAESGNHRFGWFCGDCGSRIAHGQNPSTGALSLRAGTLDDRSWIEPVGDIWTRSAQPWISFRPDALQCEVQPTDYKLYIERFRAQGRFAS